MSDAWLVPVITALIGATGSASSSDTYGLAFTTDGAYAATSPSSAFVTFEVLLTP